MKESACKNAGENDVVVMPAPLGLSQSDKSHFATDKKKPDLPASLKFQCSYFSLIEQVYEFIFEVTDFICTSNL